MKGYLTTHVLDMTKGLPAVDVKITLSRIEADGSRRLLTTVHTNDDGRVDSPLLEEGEMAAGEYELIFHAGDYFRAKGEQLPNIPFLDQVPIRFGVADEDAHYHVPLLMAPGGYSTYRGS